MKRILIVAFAALLLGGCGSSSADQFSVTPAGGGGGESAPRAVDDAYDALAGAPMSVAASDGVLANDTVNGATVTGFDATSAQGGTVSLAADGSFTYRPAAGFSGSDSFSYTLGNAAGDSTATVRLTVAGHAWFVDNAAAGGGDGSFDAPFTTLAQAEAASAAGDTIFVYRGDGTNTGYDTQVTLKDDQSLVGEGRGLEARAGTVVPAGGYPVLTGPVVMASGCTVRGVRFENAVHAIEAPYVDGTAHETDGTIEGNQFVASTNFSIDINDADGTWTVDGNSFQNDSVGISVSGSLQSTSQTFVITNNSFDGSDRALFLATSGTVSARAQVASNTATNIADPSSFLFTAQQSSTMCVDLQGNSTNTDYRFDQSGSAVLNVERLSQLTPTLNTGTVTTLGAITEVPQGYCGF